jgi:hypothetical protein
MYSDPGVRDAATAHVELLVAIEVRITMARVGEAKET